MRKQIGVGLYCVATGEGYHTLANLFGIAKSSVCAIVHDLCKTVHQVLMPDYTKLPWGDDLQEVLRGFRQRWGFPQCAWANEGAVQRDQNDVKVALNATWLFRLRSDSVPHLKVA